MDRMPTCSRPEVTDDGRAGRTFAMQLGAVAVVVLAGVDFALRVEATAWWGAAGGGDPMPGSVIDLVVLAAMAAALIGAPTRRTGWPLPTLLLASAAVMHPVGQFLAFGCHDAELALAWTTVQSAVLCVAAVLDGRWRRIVVIAVALAGVLAFAASLLAVVPR